MIIIKYYNFKVITTLGRNYKTHFCKNKCNKFHLVFEFCNEIHKCYRGLLDTSEGVSRL